MKKIRVYVASLIIVGIAIVSAGFLLTKSNVVVERNDSELTWQDKTKQRVETFIVEHSASKAIREISSENYGNDVIIAWEPFIDKAPNIIGYYIAVDKAPKYKITKSDEFADTTKVTKELSYGKHYVQVAAVYKDGKLTEMKSSEINVLEGSYTPDYENIPIYPHKVEIVKSLITRGSKTTDDKYNTAVSMTAVLPDNIINLYKTYGLKIYVADGECEAILKEQTGGVMSGARGLFYDTQGTPTVVFESSTIGTVLFHELGHAADYLIGNRSNVSEEPKFKSIFKEEKNKLFPKGSEHEKSSSVEYFAEAFQIYYLDEALLKERAPKTYEYLKKYIVY